MKKNVTLSDFQDSFRDAGRETQFTYDGLKALYEWLIELEDSMGEEMELDVIALCCDFTEYESCMSCIEDCGYDCDFSEIDEDLDEEEKEEAKEEKAREFLQENTQLIEFDSGVIIQNF